MRRYFAGATSPACGRGARCAGGGALNREQRLERLRSARLYFVCDGRQGGRDPSPLLEAALSGGADLIQLREKSARDAEEVVSLAEAFRRAADEHEALFILNDRPELVEACGADGVHVGQDDLPVEEARRLAGPAALVGLSTHSEAEVEAAVAASGDERPDQISVGPIWETPTKEGRPATGLSLIEHAARVASEIPWFAIGGIDLANVHQVAAAGAERIVVVRAIRDSADPEAAARELREALTAGVGAGS
jgi:thiamine-phosphate pyrophosphorylase